MRKFLQTLLVVCALALGLGYILYLYTPVRDGELEYFARLPSALLGLAIYAGKYWGDFAWAMLLALAALGLAFAALEKGLKMKLPAGFLLGAGMGMLALVVFLMGALHLLFPAAIKAVVLVPAAAGIYFSVARLLELSPLRRASLAETAMVVIFGLAMILTLVHPTYFYDALSYHLALPRQYLLRNSTAPLPTITYSYFPELGEMLYLAGLACSGPITAQLVNLIFWVAVILLGRETFAAWFGADRKPLATVSLLALPVLGLMSEIISNDLIVAFFTLAGVYALSREELKGWQRPLLFGMAAGFACATKLNAYLYMLVPQGVWFAHLLFSAERGKFVRRAAIAGAAFAVICLPFWLRTGLATGNPVFPALSQGLGGPLSAEQAAAIWKDAHGVSFGPGLLTEIYTLPHDLFFTPASSKPNLPGNRPFPLFGTALVAGLILLLVKKPDRKLNPVLLHGLGFYLVWIFSFRLSRFALGLWVVLAVLSAGGFSIFMSRGKSYQRLGRICLAFALITGFCLELLSGARLNGWSMLTKRLSKDEYLMRMSSPRPIELGAYPAYRWLNQNSDPRDQVLLLGPSSFFYLQRKAVANSFVDWNPVLALFNQGKSASEVCELLRKDKVGHLVYQPQEIDRLALSYPANRLTPPAREQLGQFMDRSCLVRVMSNEKRQIYLFAVLPSAEK